MEKGEIVISGAQPRPPRQRLLHASERPDQAKAHRTAYDTHLRKRRADKAQEILDRELPELQDPARSIVQHALTIYGDGTSRALHVAFSSYGQMPASLRQMCRDAYTVLLEMAHKAIHNESHTRNP